MSFFGLNLAGSALTAYQSAENVTADNITNVNTPGASRQQAILNEASPIVGSPGYQMHGLPGTFGDGVLMQSILRVHQDSYDALYRNAVSSQYFFSSQQNQLTATQSMLSEPTQGINAAYTAFQQALSSLQTGANSPDQRANVISAAQGLVTSISGTGQAIQSQLATIFQQTTSVVTQANGIIDQIASLNGQIRASTAVGDNPNTYKDQRDQLIDQLSQLLSTQTAIQANGSTLVTVNGRALVNDTVAYHLSGPIVGTNANGTPALKIGFALDPNQLNPAQVPLGQGQLAGFVDLYNNKLLPYENHLNAFTNALAFEVNRITQSAYDQNGVAGLALIQPISNSQAISTSNVTVGITQPSQVTAGLTTTAAGSIVNALNAANQTVDTSASIINNAALFASPAGALAGNLTITTDGIARTVGYSTTPGAAAIDASSISNFIATFNAQQLGVTASYDSTAQKVVFSRDPINEGLAQRTVPGYTPDPTFSLADSNAPQAVGLNGSLLGVLGAAGLQNSPNGALTAAVAAGATQLTVTNPTGFAVGQSIVIDAGLPNAETVVIGAVNGNVLTVGPTASAHASDAAVFVSSTPATAVVQNASNAFGSADNSAAIALAKLFSTNVGVPGLSTFANTFSSGPTFTATVGASVTVTERALAGISQFGQIDVGGSLTFVNQAGQTANLVVTTINRNTGTVSATVSSTSTNGPVVFQPTPAAGPFVNYTAIAATPAQTLGQYYANFITQVGLDSRTAATGTTTQTNLTSSINQARQSVDGINLDEESQNLIKYQTAYQAAAKTVSVMSQLLQTVLAIGNK